MTADRDEQPAVGPLLDRGVGRPAPEHLGPALQGVARKLREAPLGTAIPVPREAIAAAEAPLREALARELAAVRQRERGVWCPHGHGRITRSMR